MMLLLVGGCDIGLGGHQAWFWIPVGEQPTKDVHALVDAQVETVNGNIIEYKAGAVFEYGKVGLIMTAYQQCLAVDDSSDTLHVRDCDKAGTSLPLWDWSQPS